LFRDGREVASAAGGRIEYDAAAQPGVYRLEISLPGMPGTPPVPWVLTNALYVGREAEETVAAAATPKPAAVAMKYENGPTAEWTVETAPRSMAAVDRLAETSGAEIGFRFALGGARSESPFAALAMPAGADLAQFDRLEFNGRALRPMRVSVQLRAPGPADGERWQRSVYLDQRPREVTMRFDDMRPRGVTGNTRPALDRVASVLFVVDTVNADVGSNGQFVIDDVRYAR
jgi:hypothetical protein